MIVLCVLRVSLSPMSTVCLFWRKVCASSGKSANIVKAYFIETKAVAAEVVGASGARP